MKLTPFFIAMQATMPRPFMVIKDQEGALCMVASAMTRTEGATLAKAYTAQLVDARDYLDQPPAKHWPHQANQRHPIKLFWLDPPDDNRLMWTLAAPGPRPTSDERVALAGREAMRAAELRDAVYVTGDIEDKRALVVQACRAADRARHHASQQHDIRVHRAHELADQAGQAATDAVNDLNALLIEQAIGPDLLKPRHPYADPEMCDPADEGEDFDWPDYNENDERNR